MRSGGLVAPSEPPNGRPSLGLLCGLDQRLRPNPRNFASRGECDDAAALLFGKSVSDLQPTIRRVAERERGATKATRAMPAPSPVKKIDSEKSILSVI